ncbi:MAG TPA: peptidase S1 [Planctomycetaceae bacterium]|nr:peptidase S1 [Planctomycetaceae bacterium]
MARGSISVLGSAALLSIGLAVGGQLGTLQLATPLSAVPREGSNGPTVPSIGMALVQSGEHISKVSAQVLPSVVHIQAIRAENDRKVEETGSGVLMRSAGVRGLFVVTNQHVVRGAELSAVDVMLADGTRVNPQRSYRDSESDLAILQIPDGGQAAAQWGDSSSVQIGHFVLAVGSPFGLSQSVTMGIVSAKGRRDLSLTSDQTVTNQDFIQTDAAINPGNSGGPLIDMYGTVVGINTAIASNGGGNEGIGFSIPSNLVRRVFEQLVAHGRVRRAYLGVELDNDFNEATARRLGLGRARGARIMRVYNQKNSPAVRAGLRPDDVILKFNGVEVIDENHLINLVSLSDIGVAVDIEVFRGRQMSQLAVTLMDREEYRTADDPRNTFNTR